jgi:CDP-glycerol glycerophosphotransferase
MHCNSTLSTPLSKAKSVGALLLSASLGLAGCEVSQEAMAVYGGAPEAGVEAGTTAGTEAGTEAGVEAGAEAGEEIGGQIAAVYGSPEFFFDAGVPDEGGAEGGAEGE